MTIPEDSIVQNLTTMVAPPSLRRHAAGWMRFCREFVAAKRGLIEQVVAILQAHPDYPKPPIQNIQMSKSHCSDTLFKLESMDFADLDIPEVPNVSPTSSCCSPTPKSPEVQVACPEPPEEPRAPSRISLFLKHEYTKICHALKYKFEKIFPKQADLINSMLWDIKQLEFNLNLLEMQCDKLQKFFETPEISAAILKRRTCALALSFCDINLHYEKAIDCKSEVHKKMKKYVHNKLAEGGYAREQEHQRSESPIAGCSGEKNRPTAKSSKENVLSTTPQRKSNRLAQGSTSALEDPQQPTNKSSGAECSGEQNRPTVKTSKGNVSTTPQRQSSKSAQVSTSAPEDSRATSKRTPKHSAKDSREKKKLKMPETELLPVESNPGRMVQVISRENRDDVDYELSGDSTAETSRDTISTHVYESVDDIALTGSEDDCKKTRPKSSKESPKKDLAEGKDVAKTQSPSTSKQDPKKTGTKSKKLYTKKTRTKSKHGYMRVPQSDSDED